MGQFKPGASGNPKGRPRGARNKSSLLLEKMLQENASALLRMVIKAATGGDVQSALWLLGRLLPPARERALNLPTLPETSTAQDVEKASAAVVAAVAAGELLPSEGQALAAMLDSRRRAIETGDHEQRLAALEEQRK